MAYLFSYGTLRDPAVQRDTFGEEVEGEPDALPGHRLEQVEITDPDVLALSCERFHPVAVPGANSDRVEGLVFELTDAQLARADAYEVDDYERVSVTLESGRTAWIYAARG